MKTRTAGYFNVGCHMRTNLFLALIWFSLPGCSRTVEFTLPNDEILEVSTSASGKFTKKCLLSEISGATARVDSWLLNHSGGWEPSPATYVPAVLIAGKTFSLNFLHESAIINYSGGQYVHSVSPIDYEFLSCP